MRTQQWELATPAGAGHRPLMNSDRIAFAALLCAVACIGLTPSRVFACKFAGNPAHVLDPAEVSVDTTPPTAPGPISVERLRRGVGPDLSGAASSCDDLGRIVLSFTHASDDRTTAVDMGYEVTLVDGTLPNGLELPDGPVGSLVGGEGARIAFTWIDGASDPQEAFDFMLGVVAVDRAGNRAAPSDMRVVHVVHNGHSGCNSAGGAPFSPLSGDMGLVGLFGLWLLVRRRRVDARIRLR